MKKMLGFILLLITIVSYNESSAQPFGPPGEEGRPGPERLDRFRKIRLIEVLKLNEEESVRFFAKQNAHEEKVHDMMKSRNDALDDAQSIIKEKKDGKEIEKISDQILDIDQKIFAERQRFQRDVRTLLTPEQFAKFLIFERNFGRQVRDAMDDMRRGKRRGNPD